MHFPAHSNLEKNQLYCHDKETATCGLKYGSNKLKYEILSARKIEQHIPEPKTEADWSARTLLMGIAEPSRSGRVDPKWSPHESTMRGNIDP